MSQRRYQDEEVAFAGRIRWSIWRRMMQILTPYRWTMVRLLVLALAMASVDTLVTQAMRQAIDTTVAGGTGRQIVGWLLCYLVLVVMIGVGIMLLIRTAGRVDTGVSHDMRRLGFAKLQALSFSYYDRHSVGWLMARLTSDCRKISQVMTWFSVDLCWGTALIVGVSIAMLAMDWRVAIPVMVTVPVMVLISRWFQLRLLGSSRDISRTNSLITAAHNENITGMKTTRLLGREAANLREFETLNQQMYVASVRQGLFAAAYIPIVWSVAGLGVAMALTGGGYRVLAGAMEIGTLIAFISYAHLLAVPIQEMARQFAELQRAQAAVERVMELLSTEPTVVDTPEAVQAMAEAVARRDRAVVGPIESIRFEDVGFAYIADTPVLSEINLTVTRGQTFALVGPTGGGKTTIVNLLCRFYEPTTGRILIDGVDYRRRTIGWLQSHLGFVLQQPQLFSGTIEDNIRYGRLDATQEQVIEAAQLAHADPFIRAMSDGYQTTVGEGGVRLSSGQKQLISFARALLADPWILVMDEATSSIDSQTEQQIQAGLASVMAGRINFVIAHRLSTIRSADQILYIDHGRIVESGTHESLMAMQGRYHELYTSQFQRQQVAQMHREDQGR